MEIVLIVVVAVILGALIYINTNKKKLDTNNDGKVDVQEVKAAAKTAVKKAKEEVKTTAKKTASKAKTVVNRKTKK